MYKRQAVNLNVANRLADLLRSNGYEVKQYRTTTTENDLPGKSADLTNRARMANEWGADWFVSIHTNSSVNPAANGFEAYVYKLDSPAEPFAESIVKSFVSRLGSKDNGVRAANFAVLRQTRMPATHAGQGLSAMPCTSIPTPIQSRAIALSTAKAGFRPHSLSAAKICRFLCCARTE